MVNCARRSNFLLNLIVHDVEAESIVQSKVMKVTRLLVTENGAGPLKLRNAKKCVHESSVLISIV